MPKCDFIEIALWHGFSPVNLLHIFRTTFLKNISGWLLLSIDYDNINTCAACHMIFYPMVK